MKEEKTSHKTSIFKLVWCLVTYFTLISNLITVIYRIRHFMTHLWYFSHYYTHFLHRSTPSTYVHFIPEFRENNTFTDQLVSIIINFQDFDKFLSVIINKISIFLQFFILNHQYSIYHEISWKFIKYPLILWACCIEISVHMALGCWDV